MISPCFRGAYVGHIVLKTRAYVVVVVDPKTLMICLCTSCNDLSLSPELINRKRIC